MENQNNKTKNVKLYSLKAIGVTTFFGGPLAAGYLIYKNYLAINEPDKAKNALIAGIVSTIILFCIIFLIPEETIDRIPRILIPTSYTLIIYQIVSKLQGEILKEHEIKENSFYSNWKAAGVGLVSSIILVISLFGIIYIATPKEYGIYDKEMKGFYINDNITYEFLNNLEGRDITKIISEVNNKIIPLWEQNIKILKSANQIDNLPSELITQNKSLLTYCDFKIKYIELLKRAIMFDTDKHDKDLNILSFKLDSIIENVNNQ